MKRTSTIILIAALLISFSYSASAQYTKSTKLISAGISMGLYGKYYHDFEEFNLDRTMSPPLSLQFETGLSKDFGLGEYASMITAGVYVGFQNQRFFKDVAAIPESYEVFKNYTYFWGGLVGSFHGVPIINENTTIEIDASKWDIYASLKIGLVFENYNSNYLNNPTDIDVQMGIIDDKTNKTNFYIGPVLGARYYFSEQYAGFVEIGRSNLSNMSVGVTLKL